MIKLNYQCDEFSIYEYINDSYIELTLNHLPSSIDEAIKIVKEYFISKVVVRHTYEGSIDWVIKSLPNIESLHVGSSSVELNTINQLKNLKHLWLDTLKEFNLDFEKLNKLVYLNIIWQKNLSNNFKKPSNIIGLKLRDYKGESLEILSNQNNIKDLAITNANKIKNLKGVQNLKNLKMLHIFSSRSLEDFSHIDNLKNLEGLYLESCNNIKRISCINNNIKYFILKCKEVSSLSPLSKWKSIEALIIVGNILDNDVEVLKNISSLRSIYFDNKKNYNSNLKEIKEYLQTKWGYDCTVTTFPQLRGMNFYN